jgi:lipopolysaccharide transport system ATP-binding protein
MPNTVIEVENLSKKYRLGTIGTGTLSSDLNRWWASVRGKEDPYSKVDLNENYNRTDKSEFFGSTGCKL